MKHMKQTGFSIIEILFAIMILGVGFLMVAAMFPVAAQQAQANVDDTVGRSIADAGASHVATVLRSVPVAEQPAHLNTSNQFWRPAGLPESVPSGVGTSNIRVRELVNSATFWRDDPRYAWTSVYLCGPNDPGKPLRIVSIALRATTTGETSLFTGYSGLPGTAFNWQDHSPTHSADGHDNALIPVTVDFTVVPGAPLEVTLPAGQGTQAAVENAVLIVRETTGTLAAGTVFRLANKVDGTASDWQLSVAGPTLATNVPNVPAYLVGRALQSPDVEWHATDNPRTGACQVVGVRALNTRLP